MEVIIEVEQAMEETSVSEQSEQENNIITIVLTADNHLGFGGQHSRRRRQRREQLRRAFQKATDFAIGQSVDFFIQVGDLFDNTHPQEEDRSFVAARLAQLKQAGIRAFALGGVHDTPAEVQAGKGAALTAPQMSYARLGALHYLPPRAEQPLQPVMVQVRGVQVGLCGVGVVAGQQGDPLASLQVDGDIERAAIPLLLLHAPIEGLTTSSTLLDTQAQVSQMSIAAQRFFRYILAGYHHSYQHLTVGRTEVIVAGATQHIDFNDAPPGFVFLGIAPDGLRWCRHIEVDGPVVSRVVVQAADLWPEEAAASPTAKILEQLKPACTQDSIVQLRLAGALTRERYHQLDLNQVQRFGEEHAFSFHIDDSALMVVAGGEDGASSPASSALPLFEERLSPREELIALADEWIAAAQDEQEQKALQATKEELLAALWNM